MSGGGLEWEQGQAVTRMVEALQIGDHDAMAKAMVDYAAALGTRTTSVLSSIIAPVLLQLQTAHTEREANTRTIDHKLDLILEAHDATQRRIDILEAATLALSIGASERQQLVDLARTIPELTERVKRLESKDRDAA